MLSHTHWAWWMSRSWYPEVDIAVALEVLFLPGICFKTMCQNQVGRLKFCQSGPNASLSHESLGTGRFSLPGHFVLQGSCRFCRGLSRTMWLLLLWPPQRTCTSFQTVTRSAPVGPWLSPSPLADSFCEVRMRSALPSWSLAYGRCSNICWQLNKWMKGGDLVLLLRVYRWFLH